MSLSRRAFVVGAAGAGAGVAGLATLGSSSAVATSSLTFDDREINLAAGEDLTALAVEGDVSTAWDVPNEEVTDLQFDVSVSNDDVDVEYTIDVTEDLDPDGTAIEPRVWLTGEDGVGADYFEPDPGGDLSRTFDLEVAVQVRVDEEAAATATASDQATVTVQKAGDGDGDSDGGDGDPPEWSASITGGEMTFEYWSA